MPLSADGAAKIWKAVTAELKKPGAEQQLAMASKAMAADTSEDRIESKKMIARMAWGLVQDTAALKTECEGIQAEEDFIQALAANFLVEPALAARAETYATLGLPPPDESGGSITSRAAGGK